MASEITDKQIDVIMGEFSKIKEEIIQYQSTHIQIIVFIIASLTIIIPIISSNLDKVTPAVLVILLTLFCILYSAMTMHYCYNIYAVFTLGKYLHEYLYPMVNEIIPIKETEFKLLHWEEFVRKSRKNIWTFLSAQSISINGIITVLPSLFCVIILKYVKNHYFPKPDDIFNLFIFENKELLYFISLAIYSLSVIALFASFILALTNSFSSSTPNTEE